MMIKQNLSGKRIAITGATGFLGTALVERLLSSIPDCELLLLVRQVEEVQKNGQKEKSFVTMRSITFVKN